MITPASLLTAVFILTAPQHVPPAHHPHLRPHNPHHSHRPPAAAAAAQSKAPTGDDVEAVETVESVEAVDATSPAAEGLPGQASGTPIDHVFGVAPDSTASLLTPAGFSALMGHLHAALVHLPIAWVMLWAGLEVASMAFAGAFWGHGALVLGVITLASYGPAVLTGLCRFDELASASKGYEVGEAMLHRNLIFVGAGLCAVSLFIRLLNARWPNAFFKTLSLLGAVSALIVTGFSAHLGGRMVYGADFLPF
jgi:uncharacterized membrane protein